MSGITRRLSCAACSSTPSLPGHGSFLYWLPVKGTGWFLVMQPLADTHLEFFTSTDMDYAFGKERFTVYVHSTAAAADKRGTWRQPRTSRLLKPGEERPLSLCFSLRQLL